MKSLLWRSTGSPRPISLAKRYGPSRFEQSFMMQESQDGEQAKDGFEMGTVSGDFSAAFGPLLCELGANAFFNWPHESSKIKIAWDLQSRAEWWADDLGKRGPSSMGGQGSGRWGDYKKRDIVDYSVTLSIDELIKGGLDPWRESLGSITFECSNDGEVKGFLDYRLDPAFGKPFLTLTYSVGEDSQTLQIGLQKTSPHFGGVRWWFTCPLTTRNGTPCGRRVGKLYLPYGERQFGCRECHALTYWSAQTHDNRVKLCRENPEELGKVINGAFDPRASSRRMLAFKALQGNKMNQSPAELLKFPQMGKTQNTPAGVGIDQVVQEMGGTEIFISACRGSESPAVEEFVRQWKGLSKAQQEETDLGEFCQRSGIDPGLVIDEAVSYFSWFHAVVAQIRNALALPRLMQASIEAGLTLGPAGFKDREAQLMMAGLLGQKKRVEVKVPN
jgi:hypothetical protein